MLLALVYTKMSPWTVADDTWVHNIITDTGDEQGGLYKHQGKANIGNVTASTGTTRYTTSLKGRSAQEDDMICLEHKGSLKGL